MLSLKTFTNVGDIEYLQMFLRQYHKLTKIKGSEAVSHLPSRQINLSFLGKYH